MIALLSRTLRVSPKEIVDFKIIKKAIDARKKPTFVYSVMVDLIHDYRLINRNVSSYREIPEYFVPMVDKKARIAIIGFGPAGMFCALCLARAGLKPIIIERGKAIEGRIEDIVNFRDNGVLSAKSNMQFGEGGAGAFSDGKLATGVRDQRIHYILKTFVEHGAHQSILYDNQPHIGSDILPQVTKSIRDEITSLGGVFRFETQLVDFSAKGGLITSISVRNGDAIDVVFVDRVVLAIGHSARDTFTLLYEKGVAIAPKPFSLGLRIEHRQSDINKAQYKGEWHNPRLGAATYRLVCHLDSGRSVYSFCMCPGGEVMATSSAEGEIVTNGMSYFARDLENANSALLVNVEVGDYYKDSPLDGVRFQEKYEQKAFNPLFPYFAPVQLVGDFLKHKKTLCIGKVQPSYKPGYYFADLRDFLPKFVSESLESSLPIFGKIIDDFADDDAVLTGVETRSSSPIRILRDEHFAASIAGLYPCGEGAGYAGGITSSALDGIKVAEEIILSI